jgi:hypothetical protein
LIKPASTYLGRVVEAIGSGSHLVGTGRPATAYLAARMPRLPEGWLPIPDADAASAAERFTAFRHASGTIVTMHAGSTASCAVESGIDAHRDASGRLIALVTFGPQRVAIAEAGPHRFDARWQCAQVAYRLHAGPTTLGAFMQLLMGSIWS